MFVDARAIHVHMNPQERLWIPAPLGTLHSGAEAPRGANNQDRHELVGRYTFYKTRACSDTIIRCAYTRGVKVGSSCSGETGYLSYYVFYKLPQIYILQITQPFQCRCTHLQYRFAVISEAPSTYSIIYDIVDHDSMSPK